MKKSGTGTQICRGFTDGQWRGLRTRLLENGVIRNDEIAWDCAITVFERRIRERYFSCIEALRAADSQEDIEVGDAPQPDCSTLPSASGKDTVVPGFAIMALCCLLMETLASFRENLAEVAPVDGPCPYPKGSCIRPQPSGGKLIREFLQRPSFGQAFANEEVAKSFVRGIRDGILHEAETRHWVIWREDPRALIVEHQGKQYWLNRTAFCSALKMEFEAYLADLRDFRNGDLRKRFIKKMDDIVKNC
jgi:hypothetical protein